MLNRPDEIVSIKWMGTFEITAGLALRCRECGETVEVGMFVYNSPGDWTDVTENTLDQFWACAAGHFVACPAQHLERLGDETREAELG